MYTLFFFDFFLHFNLFIDLIHFFILFIIYARFSSCSFTSFGCKIIWLIVWFLFQFKFHFDFISILVIFFMVFWICFSNRGFSFWFFIFNLFFWIYIIFIFNWCYCYLFKSYFNTLSILCACFQVYYFWVLLEELCNCLLLNFSLWLSIHFVPYQNERKFVWFSRGTLGQKLWDPWFDVLKGLIYCLCTFLLVMS